MTSPLPFLLTRVIRFMEDLLTALALAIAIEGAVYALFPNAMKKMMIQVLAQPENAVRAAGMVAVTVGVAIMWMIRG